MKTILYSFIVICISSISVFAQDVIQFKDGKSQSGKILEVRQNEIVYKKSEIPNGPTYTSNKSDINYIQFENGYREVFNIPNYSTGQTQVSPSTPAPTQPQQAQAPAQQNQNTQGNPYVYVPTPVYVPAPAPIYIPAPVIRYNYGWGYNGGWGPGGGYHHHHGGYRGYPGGCRR